MQNNDAYLLNCRDEVWNQSLVKRKLKFKILHVKNNAKCIMKRMGAHHHIRGCNKSKTWNMFNGRKNEGIKKYGM
jgi:hypothetical protein